MTLRTDFVTANRVDLVLTLLPMISNLEAACALAKCRVPLEVAARVLALPLRRRTMHDMTLAERIHASKVGELGSPGENRNPLL